MKKKPAKYTKPILEELEPRLLFSADIEGILIDRNELEDSAIDYAVFESDLIADSQDALESNVAQPVRNEIVFIDPNTPGYQQLVDDLLANDDEGRNFQVFLLNVQQDGIDQISQILSQHQFNNINAIHVISHATDGAMQLGNTLLSNDNLNQYSDTIASWQSSLSEDADLLIYGCDFAVGSDGQTLVENLGVLTGADVAASDDITGHASLGGDWQLEYNTGDIETHIVVSDDLQENWLVGLDIANFSGTDGVSTILDTYIDSSNPNNSNGNSFYIYADANDIERGLLRFDNIFGAGAGQIDYGSTINSVTLQLYFQSPPGNPDTITLHRMLVNWDESSTWNSLSTSGSGIQLDDIEAQSATDASYTVSNFGETGYKTYTSVSGNMEATLQAWSDGATNYGWAIFNTSNTGAPFYTDEYSGGASAAILTVDYTLPSGGIDISGSAKQVDESTNVADGTTVRVAVNGTLQAETTTTSAGAWTISGVNVSSGDVVTTYFQGVADANEAVSVTKYDGTGNITGIDLFEKHVTIGSDDNQTITNSDLSQYDYSVSGSNEDVFHNVDGANDLTIDVTGALTDAELHIKSGNTFRPDSGSSGNVTTPDLENNGTITADGNTFNLTGNWENNSSFNAGTSTVSIVARAGGLDFTPGASIYNDITLDTNDTFSNLSGNIVGSSNFTLKSSATGVGTLTIGSWDITAANIAWQSGYISQAAGAVINVSGDFTKTGGGGYFGGDGSGLTIVFNGSGNSIFTSGGLTHGNVTVNKDIQSASVSLATNDLTLAGSSALNIQTGIFDLAGKNLDIGAGSTFSNTGTLRLQGGETVANFTNDFDSGTVVYNGSAGPYAGFAAGDNYYHLIFDGTGSWNLDAALDVDGDFTISNGTVNAAGYTLNIAGDWDSATGTFNYQTSTVVLTGASKTLTTNSSANTWDHQFRNLTIENGASYTVQTGGTANGFRVLGDLTVTGTLTTPAGKILSVAKEGGLVINATGVLGGAGQFKRTLDNTSSAITKGGTISVASFYYTLQAGSTTAPVTATTYGGDLIINGADDYTAVLGAGTLNVGGTMSVVSNAAGKTITLDNTVNNANIVAGALEIGDSGFNTRYGQLLTGSGAVDINGNVNIYASDVSGDNILNGGSSTINISGNWVNNGGSTGFNAGTSQVIFDGGNQSLSGSTTFNSFTKTDSTNDTSNVILTFDNTATQIINGTLTLDGLDADDRVVLVSDSGGNQWGITLTASATKGTLDFLSVTDSDASGSDSSHTAINPTNSIDGGNNTDWFNSTPTDISISASAINENIDTSSGVSIGTLSTSDPDVGDTFTYTIVGGADQVKFTIGGGSSDELILTDGVLDRETKASYQVTVRTTDSGGLTFDKTLTITVNDLDEFDVDAVADSNASGNTVAEDAIVGTTVGVTASASDADATNNTITYTLDDDAGGLFTIDANSGVVTVATASLNAETATSHNITVRATSSDTSFSTQVFSINVSDVDEFDVGAVSDANGAANTVAEDAIVGTAVGVTASASDADATNNTITYSLDDNAGGLFTIDANTGVVTVATASLNAETATSHNITVRATSSDTSFSTQVFTINVSDVDEFDVGAVSDSNGGANTVPEDAIVGATVGVTASAADADVTNNTITYSLDDDAGGLFAIDANTGVVTVATASLDAETATSHNITVRATSSDTSFSTQVFTINVSDVDEFDVGAVLDSNGAANTVAEDAIVGTAVGVTASASDADATNNTITYTLDDDAGGLFTIDANTGVITVNGALDYETSTSHMVTVRATSADTSFSTQNFTINVTNVNESGVGAVSDTDGGANNVAEDAIVGSTVGITADATDPDVGDTVTYSLDDDAGGLFTIDANTGVVTVAAGLDAETATSHNITVRATSSDTSFSTQVFTINVGDVDEFDVGAVSDTNGAANTVAEDTIVGSTVGVTASAADADATNNTITYSLDDDAGGLFSIDANTGVVTVAAGLDAETASSHNITVRATSSDSSFSTQLFTINVSDVDEFDVGSVSDANGAANSVAEDAIVGTAVGVVASASDGDATNNTITYSLDDDAGGLFAIDANTGVITVNGALDYETSTSHMVTVRATSADTSFSTQNFTINVTNVNESGVGAVSDTDGGANNVAEDAIVGTTVGITADATDPDVGDTVTYSLDDDAGGLFTIDANTGVVTTAAGLDAEIATSHNITVRATSSDTSFSTQVFTINVGDVDEFDVGAVSDANGAANSVAEDAIIGSAVGVTASASDADATNNTITYSLDDDVGGLFTIDANTGVVTVAAGLDAETDTSHNITVRATSSDTSFSTQVFTINVGDVDEFDVGAVSDSNGAANTVAEDAIVGTTVGVTASAADADATNNTIIYSLDDDAGGLFSIDANAGVVTVAAGLDAETSTSHNITVRATSSDSSFSTQVFAINVSDVDEFDVGAVSDSNGAANTVAEDAIVGSTVGVTASASDTDATTNTITYSLDDDAGGLFSIDANTGVVTIAAGLDAETAASHNITVRATSSDSSFSTQVFTINVTDVDEFDVGAMSDVNGAANTVAEDAVVGTSVGVTASASDADVSNNTITYSLDDDAGGLFTIDANTGVVTIAAGLDAETATSHNVTVRATSSDSSFSTQVFTINVSDVDEFDVGAVSDSNGAANTVAEDVVVGSTVGVTASAADADATNNTITYSLDDDAGGLFSIDANTGVVTVAGGLDAETATSHNITVRATSSDASFSTQVFTINVTDANETPTDVAISGSSIDENIDTTAGVSIGTLSTSDVDAGDTFTYSIVGGADQANFSIGGAGIDELILNDGVLDFETQSSYQVIVRTTDSGGLTFDKTFTVNVNDLNDAPTASNNAVTTNEDTTYTFSANDFNFADVDGDSLSQIQITTLEAVGSLQLNGVDVTLNQVISIADINAGNLTFTPVAGASGAGYDSFGFSVHDGAAYSASSYTLTIDVSAVNSAPVAVNDSLITNEDSTLTIDVANDLLANDTDADVLTVSGFIQTANGIVTDNGDGTWSYSPNPNFFGIDTFSYSIADGNDGTATATVTINVASVNDLPTGASDTFTTNNGTALVINAVTDLLANDSDLESSTLTIATVSQPVNGSLADNGDGTYTYSPDSSYIGTDTFTYDVVDANGGLAQVTVTINVTPVVVTEDESDPAEEIDANTSPVELPQENDPIDVVVELESETTSVEEPASEILGTGGRVSQNTDNSQTNDAAEQSTVDETTQINTESEEAATVENAEPEPAEEAEQVLSSEDEQSQTEQSNTESGVAAKEDAGQVAPAPTKQGAAVTANGVSVAAIPFQLGDNSFAIDPAVFAQESNLRQLPDGGIYIDVSDASGFSLNDPLGRSLAALGDQLSEVEQAISQNEKVVLGVTTGVSVSFTTGFVAWALRGGALASSFLANVPLWHGFDPLPILSVSGKKHLSMLTQNSADPASLDDKQLEDIF